MINDKTRGKLRNISATINDNKTLNAIKNEENTKRVLILPFISALEYDILNPNQVFMEYPMDTGIADFVLFADKQPRIVIEAKRVGISPACYRFQLEKYFNYDARIKLGILTNGIKYLFYSDLVRPGMMDDKPFLEFNITELDDITLEGLSLICKTNFSNQTIPELYLYANLKKRLESFIELDDEFMKYLFFNQLSEEDMNKYKPLVNNMLMNLFEKKQSTYENFDDAY